MNKCAATTNKIAAMMDDDNTLSGG
jgi:hypothetical protein